MAKEKEEAKPGQLTWQDLTTLSAAKTVREAPDRCSCQTNRQHYMIMIDRLSVSFSNLNYMQNIKRRRKAEHKIMNYNNARTNKRQIDQ